MKFLLAWSSGHNPPRAVYYQKLNGKSWGSTYDRDEATYFKTAKKALDRYRSLLRYPEDYEQYIQIGEVRAEPVNHLMFNFQKKELS